MSGSHSAAPSDRKAAFVGLIIGVVAVFVILLGVVLVTNARFAGHEGEKGAAEATK